MSRTLWKWGRPLGSVAILALLGWQVGAGPFIDGVRGISVWALAAAAGIALLTTTCCAWRWSIVARGLGVALRPRGAVVAYYRSQFLNTTLPGGVLGDVDRGVRHGHRAGDTGRGLRAAAWERVAGQVVQAGLTVSLLLVLPSPLHSSMPAVLTALVAVALGLVLLGRVVINGGKAGAWRVARSAYADIAGGLLARRAWPGIVAASTLAVTGHVLTFLIAARSAGSTASLTQLIPLALIVLVAMGLPLNIAGWGPREGAAAWVFGAAGLGAAQGVAIAVAYGVLVMVSSLPGAIVMLAGQRGAAHA